MREMCGRYTMSDPERVLREFSVLEKNPLGPRYNVAPSQGVWAICAMPGDDGPALHQLRWGLQMSHQRPAAPVIMLRSETVARGAMAASFAARRCLLLADGFFEWRRSGKASQPYLFRRPDEAPFAMAGIWQPNEEGPLPGACAVLTCPAVGAMADVHHRMPLVLEPTHHAAWLDPANRALPALKGILASPALSDFVSIRVGPRVGSPANDDARCVAPISELERAGEQRELFAAERRR
jgi:putative SOS response-associated peptidase YedK